MLRTTRNHFAPALALATLATLALSRPETAAAQAGERALLNQVSTVDFVAVGLPNSAIGTGNAEIDGEIALLGRSPNLRTWDLQMGTGLLAQDNQSVPIDGERALLGRWPVSPRQDLGDWAHRPAAPDADLAPPASKVLNPHRGISFFTLGTRGAVKLAVSSDEARYGIITTTPDERTQVVISLGATSAEGSITLTLPANQLLPNRRYAVGRSVSAFVAAGEPEHPMGAFHGETGWVTVTAVENGRIAGEFELLARGFLATDPHDENRWVAVLGQFEARGDSTALAAAGVKSRSPM
jgi:hypothetical protein